MAVIKSAITVEVASRSPQSQPVTLLSTDLTVIMQKRKSSEDKDGSKVTKQEPSRSSARLSIRPAPSKPEPKPRKTSTKKEPRAEVNRGAKGQKEEKEEAGKEGTTRSENVETRAEEALKMICR
ncbi:High mobility group nucleosome-binding domain-containing protein 3 [Fukomys damarensis]|uniref:High mobility group nucleosome-binding domain-containing protein 3 n=1 Tax=Fukomys damarensis TaxID=885580 RepID=A0A091DNZ3_FUKDA|nr:High mobility group nucleosome-binding domain-containing protein 3 [Fukomys damarensis]